jgi:multidrug resistance efflux pump
VTKVAVKPHQEVEAGDVLFKIDPEPYQHIVAQKRAMLAEASQDTRELQTDLSAALAEVRAKAAERDRAEQAYHRVRRANLAAGGMAAVPELQVENSRNAYLAAQAEYESAV